MMLSMAACSRPNKAEEAVSEIEAAQMQGRNDARYFITNDWPDSVKLMQEVRAARERGSRYDSIGKDVRHVYDSAFVSTIRTVRPDLARYIDADTTRVDK